MIMFATLKKFTLIVLVPAVVGLGVWAEWTTLTIKFAMLGTSAAESIPEEITTDGVQPYARTADPEIKPVAVPDRKPEIVTVEPVQPQAATINTEPAQTTPAPQTSSVPAGPKVKRLPFAIERRPESGTAAKAQVPAQAIRVDAPPAQESPAPPAPEAKFDAKSAVRPEAKPAAKSEVKAAIKPAAAGQQPVEKVSSAIKAPEATKPQAPEKPTPKSAAKSEAKPEAKLEAKSEVKIAIKPAAADQQPVEKASSAIKAPEATKPQTQDKPQTQEKPTPKSAAKSEAKLEAKPEAKSEAKDEAKDAVKDATKTDDRPARKENAAKREKAEQTTQSRSGRSEARERSQRSSDPDDFNPRRAFMELRRSRSMADFYDRLEALGWGGR